MIEVKVVNKSDYDLPKYAKPGDSGMDVRANIQEPIVLGSLERALVPTGLCFQIPEGYEIQVRPRSGLAAKHGISLCNAIGTVDHGYTGEVKVILVNLSKDPYTIEPGERIAQLVLASTSQMELIEVSEVISETGRGEAGFGSTGKL